MLTRMARLLTRMARWLAGSHIIHTQIRVISTFIRGSFQPCCNRHFVASPKNLALF